MNDRSVPLTSILIYSLWSLVLGLLAATWVAAAASHPVLAQALGVTTCVETGVAMTATIRAYVMRVCRLLRVVNGLEGETATVVLRSMS